MTLVDIMVPLAALGVAGIGILIIRVTDPDRSRSRRR
jgi:hypothetical protein